MPRPLGKDEKGNTSLLTGVEMPFSAAFTPLAGFGEGFQRGGEKLLSHLGENHGPCGLNLINQGA
jgi:hypothetical protein